MQTKSAIATELERQRAWLREIMARTRLKATPLARQAGVAPSTLLRALDPDSPTLLDSRTVTKLRDAFAAPQLDAVRGGFAEADLAEYVAPSNAAAIALPPDHYRRRVTTRALELHGVLPDDILTLDMSQTPAAGDVVDAQVYLGAGAETRLRLYQPPFLITRSMDASISATPLLIDARVRIAAVMIHLERRRSEP